MRRRVERVRDKCPDTMSRLSLQPPKSPIPTDRHRRAHSVLSPIPASTHGHGPSSAPEASVDVSERTDFDGPRPRRDRVRDRTWPPRRGPCLVPMSRLHFMSCPDLPRATPKVLLFIALRGRDNCPE